MSTPQVVSVSEWLAARKELQLAEEQAVALLTELSAKRQALPAAKVERDYVFEGQAGQVSLLDMFEGRRQLIVQHFMFGPEWDEGCPVCSLQADGVPQLAHLHANDTTFAVVSRAPGPRRN
jgi:predicted dithiol-disulfide oxidoreductase (DUF899 family)